MPLCKREVVAGWDGRDRGDDWLARAAAQIWDRQPVGVERDRGHGRQPKGLGHEGRGWDRWEDDFAAA